jgi:hypothetical protein
MVLDMLGANGADYTSLGQRPRYADPNQMRGLKARSISRLVELKLLGLGS